MTFKKAAIAIAIASIANVAFADDAPTDGKDHYVSLGMGTLSTEYGVELDSYGFVWNQFEQDKNLGLGMSVNFATNDGGGRYYSYEEAVWDVTFNLPYRFESLPYLTVYPMVGAAFYVLDSTSGSDSDIGLSYGVGAQVRIPQTNVFFDVNLKQAKIADINADNVYFGIGYRF